MGGVGRGLAPAAAPGKEDRNGGGKPPPYMVLRNSFVGAACGRPPSQTLKGTPGIE